MFHIIDENFFTIILRFRQIGGHLVGFTTSYQYADIVLNTYWGKILSITKIFFIVQHVAFGYLMASLDNILYLERASKGKNYSFLIWKELIN